MTDPDRHVSLDGQANFRDLGGYKTVDGRRVRFGQVYRSGRLATLSDGDVSRLSQIGIRTVVNLLTDDDRDIYGEDRLPAGANAVSLAIDSDTATELSNKANDALRSGDFAALPPTLNAQIHRLLIHDGADSYRKLAEIAADQPSRPVVFHCSHGVHRTGTGAAILLTLLGVPWSTVQEDYLLSNEYRANEVRHRLDQLRSLAAQNRHIPAGDVDMTNAEAFMIQQAGYIDASMAEIVAQFGSFDNYVRDGLELNSSTIEQLRTNLLE